MYSRSDKPVAKIVAMSEFVKPYFLHAAKKFYDAAAPADLKLPIEKIEQSLTGMLEAELAPDVEPGMLAMLKARGWLVAFVKGAVEALVENLEAKNEQD